MALTEKYIVDSNYCKCYNNAVNKRLEQYKRCELSLDDLVSTAVGFISSVTTPPVDGRVAPYPDVRTVRYYQTVGILKKPLRYDGRNAIYGYQHLLQLIAIKLLQRQGLSLVQIQTALIQTSLADLERSLEGAFEIGGDETPTQKDWLTSPIVKPLLSPRKIEEKLPCDEANRRRFPEVPIYQRPRKNGTRDLIAVEVAPGISVLIDPEVVQDPKGVIGRILRLLNAKYGDKE
jgi:DNA-binding transcriptional MerR regulator